MSQLMQGKVGVDDVDGILSQRGSTNGEFTHMAQCTQGMKREFEATCVLSESGGFQPLSDAHIEAAHMIMHKLARIAAGDSNVNDHWDDIAGYAKLASARCAN